MDAKKILDLIAVLDGAKRLGLKGLETAADRDLRQLDADVSGRPVLRPGDTVSVVKDEKGNEDG